MDKIDEKELDAIDIDAPLDESGTEAPEPEEPNIPTPKKSHKARTFVIISIILAILLIGASVYYWMFIHEKPADITSSTTSTAKVDTTPDPNDTTDYAKAIIDKIRISEASIKAAYPKSGIEDTDPSAPAYKYGSSTYYVSGNFGHSLMITNATAPGVYDADFNTAAEQAAISVLDKEDLTKTLSNFSYRYSNDNGTVTCSLSHLGYPVSISCANIRDYKAPSEAVAPFAKVYLASPEASQNSEVVFGQPNIVNKSGTFKKATVGIGGYEGVGGFAGLFYNDGKGWTYWRGTQSVIACKDYNTYALQKAFEGDECYVEGQTNDSVVTVTLKS